MRFCRNLKNIYNNNFIYKNEKRKKFDPSKLLENRSKLIVGIQGAQNKYQGQNAKKNEYYHNIVGDRIISICK